MISIIICSRSKELITKLVLNIESTVGVEYEIVVIDNSKGEKSIFEAYNCGARKSKYEYLCFVHEDIEFVTTGWGHNVCYLLNKKETGVIGVAGSAFLPKNPAPWWISVKDTSDVIGKGVLFYNITHGTPGQLDNIIIERNPLDKWDIKNASVIDGVFIAVKKKVWKEFAFDEKTFNNFHFYDVDFSASVGLNYKNYVIGNILIRHFSRGKVDKNWLISAVSFHKKWKNKLCFP